MSKITLPSCPPSMFFNARFATAGTTVPRHAAPSFSRGAGSQVDAMKREQPDNANTLEPKRQRPTGSYDPRTTPPNNPFYDPSLDQYLGLHQPTPASNPFYDPSLDQYLGLNPSMPRT
ncbi:MAG: hypothetical protein EOP70_11535 [Variovorax sp.]|jgi:hypothetical protein|nr:MAG: hypothetical protein EOP70_11535 [Variovorax sp.]